MLVGNSVSPSSIYIYSTFYLVGAAFAPLPPAGAAYSVWPVRTFSMLTLNSERMDSGHYPLFWR